MFFSQFRKFGRAVEHAHRFRTIIAVFLTYGYDDLAHRLPLPRPFHLPLRRMRKKQEEISLLTAPQRLRRAFEELGPTFIKLGQLLSTRSHLLPRPFQEELTKLHDQVPPIPFEEVKKVLTTELYASPDKFFASIDHTPIGSASIAQVHRALRLTGERCVLKVQRPDIEKVVRVDLEIMAQLAALLEKHIEGWQVHRPTALVAEFARRMEQELDFDAEASHIERFSHQFIDEPTLYVPRVFRQTTTHRVLTLEEIEGIKATDLARLDAACLNRREIASRIADLVMKQIFVHGFFHADPHPGNIQVLPGNIICFLDFGMMGFLDEQTRQTFARFIIGLAQRDERAAAAALLKLTNAELDPPRPGFEADVAEFMHRHFYRPIGQMVFSRLVNDLFLLTARYGLTLPPNMATMLKALALMENVVRRLDPSHDVLGHAQPFLQKVRVRQLEPRRLAREWSEFGREMLEFVRNLPVEARRLVALVKEGRSRFLVHHQGLDGLINTLERIVNRLAFALVLSSLIIASSVIVHARVPPMWHGIPVIGLAGYCLAGMMGFWLLIAMVRHGKM